MDTANPPDNYNPPWWAINGHVETIIPALLRKTPHFDYQIEKLALPDGDELWLNWKTGSSEKLAGIVPGLESDATRSYVKNLSRLLFNAGYDILVPDHRGGVRINKLFRSYHSGNTGDLALILSSQRVQKYHKVCLIGFSLGGNIVLKYLGEKGGKSGIYKAAAVSTPLDLDLCSAALERKSNRLFSARFLKSMKRRLKEKIRRFPGRISLHALRQCDSVRSFYELYTAPAHGFRNAESYYKSCSSRYFLQNIATPTLVINSMNDPMIPLDNEILNQLKNNAFLHSRISSHGGHLGFPNLSLDGANWYEKKILEFFQDQPTTLQNTAADRNDG